MKKYWNKRFYIQLNETQFFWSLKRMIQRTYRVNTRWKILRVRPIDANGECCTGGKPCYFLNSVRRKNRSKSFILRWLSPLSRFSVIFCSNFNGRTAVDSSLYRHRRCSLKTWLPNPSNVWNQIFKIKFDYFF